MWGVAIRLALRRARHAMADGWLAVHVAVSAVPAWFAFIFAVPPSTFASAPNSFRVWAEIAPEPVWAVICASCSAVGFASLAASNRALRQVSSAILASWHGWAALAFLAGNPHGTGSGTYAIIAGLATLAMLERGRRT